MTIGIGVLASDRQPKPDHVILMADTKGSFGHEFSMNRLHKTFAFPVEKLYATAAGFIDRAAELVTLIDELFKAEKPEGYTMLLLTINKALYQYRQQRFAIEIAPTIWTSKAEMESGGPSPETREKIDAAWPSFRIGCELLVGTFGPNGQAYLFSIMDDKFETVSFPGFAAIGSGSRNAMFWLSHRNQHLARPVKQSAYHAFEAKVMAESSAFVNDKLDLLIANSEKHFLLTDFKPMPQGTPFTIDELRTMWATYGPQPTDDIQ